MARPLLVSWVLSLALACAGGGSWPPVGQVGLFLGASGASPEWAAIGVTPKQVRFIRADGAPVPVAKGMTNGNRLPMDGSSQRHRHKGAPPRVSFRNP